MALQGSARPASRAPPARDRHSRIPRPTQLAQGDVAGGHQGRFRWRSLRCSRRQVFEIRLPVVMRRAPRRGRPAATLAGCNSPPDTAALVNAIRRVALLLQLLLDGPWYGPGRRTPLHVLRAAGRNLRVRAEGESPGQIQTVAESVVERPRVEP